MKKNLILLFSTIFVILLLLEIFLRFFYPQNLHGWYAKQDENGLNILRKNITHIHRANYRIIKYKFGNLNNRITTKNKNKKNKILILGDSFTFGWLEKDENIFVNLLQKKFPYFYFVNPSVPGWGASDYVRFVENYCSSIKPKKIMVMLNTDDLARAYNSKLYLHKNPNLDLVLNNDLKLGKNTIHKKESKFHNIPFYNFLIKNSHLMLLVRENIYYFFYKPKKNPKYNNIYFPNTEIKDIDKAVRLGELLFLRLKNISKKCNTELNIIYLGWYNYKRNILKYKNPTLYFLKNADNFFKSNGINFFNMTIYMNDVHQDYKKYIIPYDGHPNKYGHEKISKVLIENFNNF